MKVKKSTRKTRVRLADKPEYRLHVTGTICGLGLKFTLLRRAGGAYRNIGGGILDGDTFGEFADELQNAGIKIEGRQYYEKEINGEDQTTRRKSRQGNKSDKAEGIPR